MQWRGLAKAALQVRAPAAAQLLFDAKLVPVDPLAPAPSVDSDVPDVFADPFKPQSATQPIANKPAIKGKQSLQRTPYDLLIAVPQNQIAYSATPDGSHTVKLQFAFDAYDLNGKFLGSHMQDVSLTLTSDRFAHFQQAPVIFHERIAFLPGPLFLRVGVLDAVSNRVGSLEIPLTVPGG